VNSEVDEEELWCWCTILVRGKRSESCSMDRDTIEEERGLDSRSDQRKLVLPMARRRSVARAD
jgi:hypothetical protein